MNVCVWGGKGGHMHAYMPIGPASSVERVRVVIDQLSLLGNHEEKAGREWQVKINW